MKESCEMRVMRRGFDSDFGEILELVGGVGYVLREYRLWGFE